MCEGCKHFTSPSKCTRWGRTNLPEYDAKDHSANFWDADRVYVSWCRGDWFEQRPAMPGNFEEPIDIDALLHKVLTRTATASFTTIAITITLITIWLTTYLISM